VFPLVFQVANRPRDLRITPLSNRAIFQVLNPVPDHPRNQFCDRLHSQPSSQSRVQRHCPLSNRLLCRQNNHLPNPLANQVEFLLGSRQLSLQDIPHSNQRHSPLNNLPLNRPFVPHHSLQYGPLLSLAVNPLLTLHNNRLFALRVNQHLSPPVNQAINHPGNRLYFPLTDRLRNLQYNPLSTVLAAYHTA
jgi:hypothetical protein